MKKYLLMMTLALLGGVTQVKAWNYLVGSFNSWTKSPANCLDNGPVAVYLTAGTYQFKVLGIDDSNNETWTGKDDTKITETTTINMATGSGNDITLTTSAAGYYVFSTNWDSGLALTVRYPDTMVYFYNALGWSKVYLHDGWWNNGNGASNKNALRGVEMTAGANNIYSANIPSGSFYRVTFTSDKQVNEGEGDHGAGYDNFYATNVVWNADGFDSSKPLYVPTNVTDETLNTCPYYYYGTWHAYPTYTRDVTDGNFGTICLPFAAEVTGATVFKIVSKVMSGTTLTGINLESVDALEAGKAYIFKATGSTLTATYSGSYADASADFGMMGNLSASPVTVAQGNYVVNSNKLRKVTGDAVTVGQYKAYVTLDGISEADSRSSDFISFNEGTTTGIETVSDSQIKTNETYDLQGRRVNVTNRQKGLYIVNGKKYIVK